MKPHRFTKPRPFSKNDTYPKNVDECIQRIITWGKDLSGFAKKSEGAAVADTHHSVGQWIRNEWGLWAGSPLKEYFIQLGVTHPDDMSGTIIRCLHRHLNNKPLNLEEEIERIKNVIV